MTFNPTSVFSSWQFNEPQQIIQLRFVIFEIESFYLLSTRSIQCEPPKTVVSRLFREIIELIIVSMLLENKHRVH